MLIKVNDFILNLSQISYVDLNVEQEEVSIEDGVAEMFSVPGQPSLKPQVTYGVQITLSSEINLYFWNEDAELLRWYFNHAISDVVDIRNFKEG